MINLSVCLSVREHISETMHSNFAAEFSVACYAYLSPRLGPHLVLQYVIHMYFRFCGWRHTFHIGDMAQVTKKGVSDSSNQKRSLIYTTVLFCTWYDSIHVKNYYRSLRWTLSSSSSVDLFCHFIFNAVASMWYIKRLCRCFGQHCSHRHRPTLGLLYIISIDDKKSAEAKQMSSNADMETDCLVNRMGENIDKYS